MRNFEKPHKNNTLVVKYTNVFTDEVMFADAIPKTKEIDGVKFIEMSFSSSMNPKFWFRSDAVKKTK